MADETTRGGIEADPILGPPLDHFPSDRMRLILPPAVISIAVGLVLNNTLALTDPVWGPLLTTILSGGLALALGWRALHFWNREVVVYERGFSYREGAETVYFLYEEVASIRVREERVRYFFGLLRRTIFRTTLTTLAGENIALTRLYHRVEVLSAQLEARIYPLVERRAAQATAAGERVAFGGGLLLGADGLHGPAGVLPWAEFGGTRLGGGALALLTRDGAAWLRVPLAALENAPVLLKLLKQR